jgi:acetyl esterase/lipase
MSNPFHPDLRAIARWLPRAAVPSKAALWLFRRMTPLLAPLQRYRPPAGLRVEDRRIDGPPGAPPVRVRLFTPEAAPSPRPALLWIHGGGYLLPGSKVDDEACATFARRLGATVLSLEYRVAPEDPYPAALHDCAAAYRFLHDHAAALGVDPARVVIGGNSAGGGLAAALALYLHDHGLPAPRLQVLVYPMLDDRTVEDPAYAAHLRVWNTVSNRLGWASYLGGLHPVPDHAAPARRADLRGLPPAWIGVGTLDLFYAEDVDYAQRLEAAGVRTELEVVEGAFHGFDVVAAGAPVSRRFFDAQVEAIRAAVGDARGDAGP